MLHAQNKRAVPAFPPLHLLYGPETFQGVTMDSLGVEAIKIGRRIAPDCRQHRQEAPKRSLAWFSCFFVSSRRQRGR
jgi:hypothetical protein